jgi:two-component system CheB/CheR fusion protein
VIYDADLVESATWFNKALTTEYGYPELPVRPRAWSFEAIHPEDVRRVRQSIDHALESHDKNWSTEYRFQRNDGSYIDVRDRAHIIRDTNNKAVRIIGSILDISKQTELARAKDKFISLVSHQLRTPLTAMRLHTEMLADGLGGELNDRGKSYVEKIETSTVRMIQLVGDILNISQIERGRLKVVPVATDIEALIAWHIDEILPSAASKQISITFTQSKTIQLVSVDPVLYSQIIHNLLSNAIRYTSIPESVIAVTFVKNTTSYVLCVKDQGIGIPKSVQPKIFTSFFRAENAVQMHGEGTGLGLYFIKLIVEATGGKTWFETAENVGTSFYVSLPLTGMEAVDQLQSTPLELHV